MSEPVVAKRDKPYRRLLVTGAAGNLAGVLRPGLAGLAAQVRLTDVRPFASEHDGEEVMQADLRDPNDTMRVMQDVDCVLHLAGFPQNAEWEKIRSINIDVTYNVFEAARLCSVRRVVFASTNRVGSFYPAEATVSADMPPRPDGLYGVTKIFGETLGRLYADQHGISVACLRIGAFRVQPETERHLSNWVSAGDLVRAVRACVEASHFRYEVFYAVSANTRVGVDLTAGKRVGYEPADNAEQFAANVAPGSGYGDNPQRFHGGAYCVLAQSRDARDLPI